MAAALAVATALLGAASAGAHGNGCSNATARDSWSGSLGDDVQVRMNQTTSWTNCNTHTHPREIGISFVFITDDDERDWRNDDDDYVTYDCSVRTDERLAASWSGRLDYNDRADGFTVGDQSQMLYPNHPRTVCSGTIVQDWSPNFDWRTVSRPL
jgi:hypothetical protein